MGKDPEADDDELAGLVMPRDPRLPATEVLEVPPEREDERPLTHVGAWPAPLLELTDDTLPSPLGDEGATLDEPMPPHLIEPPPDALAEWDQDVETVVDDPSADTE